jgi:hypothetical protein
MVLGLRLGATLALLETARTGGAGVIAIAPVVDGFSQVHLWKMRSKIRAELTQAAAGAPLSPAAGRGAGGERLDFDGYEVAKALFDDVAALDLLADCAALSCPALVVQVSHRAEAGPESTKLLARLGPQARLKALRMEPFWDKLDNVDTRPLNEAVLQGLEQMSPEP